MTSARRRVRGPAQSSCLAVARSERANIDAALAWSAEHDPALGVRIAIGFGWTWVVLGDGAAGAARVRHALDAAPSVGDRDAVAALLLAGWLEASAGDVDQAADDLGRAGARSEGLDDERLTADVQRHRAFLRIQQGRPRDALDDARASFTTYRRLGLDWEAAGSRNLEAFSWMALGDTALATVAATDAVELRAPLGDDWGLVHAEAMLGTIAHAERRLDEAAVRLDRAAATSERLGFLGQAALHLTNLGRVHQRGGDHLVAIETLDRAFVAARRSGDPRVAATARLHLARSLRAVGRDDEARAALRENVRFYEEHGGGDGARLSASMLASVTAVDDPASTVTLVALIDDARAHQDLEAAVVALDVLARRRAERGDVDRARQALTEADQLAPGIAHLVDDEDRPDARVARHLIESHAG